MTAAVLTLLAALQGGVLDQGVLVVLEDTVPVARESFRLTSVPATSDASWTIAATARYDRGRPIVILNPVLVVARDSQPARLQYEVSDGRGARTILAQHGRGRLTVRELARGAERAREYHAPGRTVILDDSVFALYVVAAWHAGPQPVTVTAVYPRHHRRETLTIRDHGTAPTVVQGESVHLHRVTLEGSVSGAIDVWTDAGGRLMKVEVPARGVRAERLPDG